MEKQAREEAKRQKHQEQQRAREEAKRAKGKGPVGVDLSIIVDVLQ